MELTAREMAHRSNENQKKKFGKKYSLEMSRRSKHRKTKKSQAALSPDQLK